MDISPPLFDGRARQVGKTHLPSQGLLQLNGLLIGLRKGL